MATPPKNQLIQLAAGTRMVAEPFATSRDLDGGVHTVSPLWEVNIADDAM